MKRTDEIERLEQWHRRHAEALDNGLDYELAALHADYPPSPMAELMRLMLLSDARRTVDPAGSDAGTAHPPPTA